MVENGQGRCLPVLSSVVARDILTRGYDARTLARIYANTPSSEAGLVGQMADRVVLNLPIHHALRERLDATVGEMAAAAVMQIRAGETECRILSTPCGLGFELFGVLDRLHATRPDVGAKVRCWGVDLDPEGTLLPEAQQRARSQRSPVQFLREDLRRHRGVASVAALEGPFHIVLSLGLSQKLSLPELQQELRFFSGLMAPGATLILDRWDRPDDSPITTGLGVRMKCHTSAEFHPHLKAAGLTIEREHPTGEGGSVLIVARKLAG